MGDEMSAAELALLAHNLRGAAKVENAAFRMSLEANGFRTNDADTMSVNAKLLEQAARAIDQVEALTARALKAEGEAEKLRKRRALCFYDSHNSNDRIASLLRAASQGEEGITVLDAKQLADDIADLKREADRMLEQMQKHADRADANQAQVRAARFEADRMRGALVGVRTALFTDRPDEIAPLNANAVTCTLWADEFTTLRDHIDAALSPVQQGGK